MPEPTCPFQAPLISGAFGCKLARSVTARNAPQVHCRSGPALGRCRQVYEELKSVGLDAFGVEDDPAVTPHSTYMKIQCGGLLGLQERVDPDQPITDINALLDSATENGTRSHDLPYSELAESIVSYKPPRRRGRSR